MHPVTALNTASSASLSFAPARSLSRGLCFGRRLMARPTAKRATSTRVASRKIMLEFTLPHTSSQRKGVERPEFVKPTLFDVPVSNNGARVRMLIYLKGLEQEIDILPPAELGGLKSSEYCALNPQGKMPLFVLPDGTSFPESEVILQYLADIYSAKEPQLVPHTPELRAKAALAVRFHDLYITTIQGCMYKKMDAKPRAEMLAGLNDQLDVLEEIILGPYFVGHSITTADCSIFPTFIFMNWILPKHFGWKSIFLQRPKLEAWWTQMCKDPIPARIKEEVEGGLQGWEDKNRWDELGITEQVADVNYMWRP